MLVTAKDASQSILYVETTEDHPRHVDKLFQLWCDLQALPETALDIFVDFHYCQFLNHLGVAFLGGLAHLVEARGGRFNFNWNSFTGQVLEIYLNAFEHSQSSIGVFSCGQHYPRARKLKLTVIDFGKGIPSNVRSLPENASFSSAEALDWAFQAGNSTKRGDVSRGMGLSLLQSFVTKNRGNLRIFSNDACISIDDNGARAENKRINFTGTLVDIALRCDKSYCCLASEASSAGEPWF